MASLNMNGPYELRDEVVDRVVEENVIGNYAYGKSKEDGFYVYYVGRSDNNLREEIKKRKNSDTKFLRCTHFKFSIARSSREAFEKECKNYHDFNGDKGKLLNEIHPDKPDNTNLSCPYCK